LQLRSTPRRYLHGDPANVIACAMVLVEPGVRDSITLVGRAVTFVAIAGVVRSVLWMPFSKKVENHAHSVALFAMYYNFVR
jgi:hypothetical protein